MKLAATTDSFEMLRHIPGGSVGSPRGNCEGCGMFIWSEGGYRVPGLPGIHCSIGCVETVLFGHERCRWCGREMDQPHSSINSTQQALIRGISAESGRDPRMEKNCLHSIGDKRLGAENASLALPLIRGPWDLHSAGIAWVI